MSATATATEPVTPPAEVAAAANEPIGDSSETQAQRLEAFAFLLWRTLDPKSSFDAQTAQWRADAGIRAEMRAAATGFLKDAEDSAGLKLVVGRRQRLEKFISSVITEPAKPAYVIGG